MQPISSSPFVRTVLAGLQRQLTKPKAKKDPITSSDGSLADLWLMALALLAFATFLRCDDLIKLHACNVSFAAEHMAISMRKSKTDR